MHHTCCLKAISPVFFCEMVHLVYGCSFLAILSLLSPLHLSTQPLVLHTCNSIIA